MNGVYVGGAYTHGAFRGGFPGINALSSGGKFYVERRTDVRHPSSLIVFATARGGDVRDGTWWSYGADDPDSGTVRPGYWIVTPPRPHPRRRGYQGQPYQLGGGWVNQSTWDHRRVPSTWGMIDARHFQRVITGMMDGSSQVETISDLRDTRRWSNYADRPNWDFVPGPG